MRRNQRNYRWPMLMIAVTGLLIVLGSHAGLSGATVTMADPGPSTLAADPALPRDFALPIPMSEPILHQTAGTDYYVATDGNDDDPGTESQPWRTIQKAAETLVAGETVYIKAGTYQERVMPQNSGSAGNYIVYAAYPGHTVTIDGAGITLPQWWGGLFDVSSKSYIRISGLRIMNAGPNLNNVGILVDESSHIIIEGNYIYNTTSSGIGVWNSSDITIDGNEVELANNDGEQENITIAITHDFEVRYNHIHHGGPGSNGGEGIDAKDGSYDGKVYGNVVHDLNRLGIYVDAWDKHTYNIEVFQNVVYDIAAFGMALASEAGGLLENVRVYNNIIYGNEHPGIGVWGCCPDLADSHPMLDLYIINNTIFNNGWDWGGGIYLDNPDIENLVIRNNILSQNLSFQIIVEPGMGVPLDQLTVDHNLIDGFRGEAGEIRGEDYVEGAPRFVDSAAPDFHLQENSPAIDQGSPADAPGDDFEGHTRPNGAGYDIGAFELLPCLLDANANGQVDVVDIMTTAQRPACVVHLPLLARSWRQPWPTTVLHRAVELNVDDAGDPVNETSWRRSPTCFSRRCGPTAPTWWTTPADSSSTPRRSPRPSALTSWSRRA
ncbi:MAG: right-handed parallel beta-helix repeat-containing protein [Anaerolineae bacterium]